MDEALKETELTSGSQEAKGTRRHSAPRLEIAEVDSPVGPIVLAVNEHGLCALEFADREERFHPRLEQRFGWPTGPGRRADRIARLIKRYLDGDIDLIDSIEVDTGGTKFQRRVWHELRSIPPGHPISYGELARRIGNPKAMRAVGAANGANPVSIVVPCHRVIASNGTLHGYGGGLDRKRWLLDHEVRHALKLVGES